MTRPHCKNLLSNFEAGEQNSLQRAILIYLPFHFRASTNGPASVAQAQAEALGRAVDKAEDFQFKRKRPQGAGYV
jgi:hypothetical protein